jgi:hypothetical protein
MPWSRAHNCLQGVVIAIGEECIRIALQHWLREMQRIIPVVQEDTAARVESGRAFDARKSRRPRYDG